MLRYSTDYYNAVFQQMGIFFTVYLFNYLFDFTFAFNFA